MEGGGEAGKRCEVGDVSGYFFRYLPPRAFGVHKPRKLPFSALSARLSVYLPEDLFFFQFSAVLTVAVAHVLENKRFYMPFLVFVYVEFH